MKRLVVLAIIAIVLMLVVGGLRAYEMYLAEHRYYLVSASGPPYGAYKIDRKTGQVWHILRDKEYRCWQGARP